MAFTSDGSQLVVLVVPGTPSEHGIADAQITIRDAVTLKPIGRSIEPEAFVGAYVGVWYASPQFALTPDDRFLITASEDGELAQWDLRTRRKTRTWRIETGLAPALAVSPDGRTVAVGIKHGVQLVDVRSGTVRTAASDSAGSPSWVLFSPDGKMVVATNRDKTVTRWDVESATPLETLRGHSNFVQQPVFSPDGQTLYTVSHDGTAIAWDLTGDRRLGRPFTFTHDRTFSDDRLRRPSGEAQPRRPVDRGRPQGTGRRALGRAQAHAGRSAPSRYVRRGQVTRLLTGWANAGCAPPTARSRSGMSARDRPLVSRSMRGFPALVLAVGFSPDGATLATASSDLGLRFWDAATGDTSR